MPKVDIDNNEDKYITSPKGELLYTNVTGEGKVDYNGTGREFVTTLKLPKKEGEAFLAQLQEVFDDYKPKWASELETPTNKWYRLDEDDNYLFAWSTKTEFTVVDKDTNDNKTVKITIGIINAKNKEVTIPEGEGIGNGSIGRVQGSIYMHEEKKEGKCSLSLTLSKIQITKYVKYVANTGFDEDEDDNGFEDFGGVDGDFNQEEDKPKKKKKKKK